MPQPPEVEALLNPLLALYRSAWERVMAEQGRIANDPARWRRRDRLREIQGAIEREMDLLRKPTTDWMRLQFPRAYGLGVANGLKSTGGNITGWTTVHREAVQEMADGLFGDLLGATQFVKDDTKRLIRDVIRDEALQKAIAGDTAEAAGRRARRLLEEKGIAAVIYKDGSRHGLAEYSDMAMRSTTAIAYNRGTLNADLTINWFEVFDGIDCIAEGSRFVPYGGLKLLARGRYRGTMYTIRAGTHSSRSYAFTVGPNHPVLTSRGLVLASFLREGDELVYDSRFGDPSSGTTNAYFEQMPRVEDLFATLRGLGFPFARSTPVRDDFHGDAEFVEGEVEVVRPARGLLAVRDSSGIEQASELHLIRTYTAKTLMTCPSGVLDLVDRSELATSSRVRRCDARLALLRAFSAGSQAVAVADRSLRYATFGEDATDGRFGHAQSLRDGGAAELLLGVQADDLRAVYSAARHLPIVSIETDDYDGWVYDATTGSGIFSADAFVVKNCGLTFHEDPTLANGMIVDRQTAEAYPIAHPRCRRSLGPRPDVTSPEEAQRSEPSTTAEQRADQARAEVRRREQVERRAAMRARRRASTRRGSRTIQRRIATRRREVADRHGVAVPARVSDQVVRSFPVSQAARYAPIEASLNAVDDALPFINHIPVVPLEVVDTLPPSTMGATRINVATGKVMDIRISSSADAPMMTTAHEVFHLVDVEGMPPSGAFSTAPLAEQLTSLLSFAGVEQPPVSLGLRRWWSAVQGSSSYKQLDLFRSAGLFSSSSDPDYLLYPHELFARSAAQFVARESANPTMLDEVARIVSSGTRHLYAEQWEDDDFDEIHEALRTLFREEFGWMS